MAGNPFDDWHPPRVAVELEGAPAVGGTLGARIARAVSQALDASGMGREEVAARMSALLGESVTKNMIDAYASQARSATHRITLERFLAMIEVTGQTGLIGFAAEQFGLIVVPARYAELIELHFVEEQMAALEARRASLGARWKGKR